jgi:hypothetical protein
MVRTATYSFQIHTNKVAVKKKRFTHSR